MSDEGRSISIQEAGRRGGKTTKERYGQKHYEELGSKGGKALLEKYGPQHFADMGKRGGKRMSKYIQAGKALIEQQEKEQRSD